MFVEMKWNAFVAGFADYGMLLTRLAMVPVSNKAEIADCFDLVAVYFDKILSDFFVEVQIIFVNFVKQLSSK